MVKTGRKPLYEKAEPRKVYKPSYTIEDVVRTQMWLRKTTGKFYKYHVVDQMIQDGRVKVVKEDDI